MNVWLHECLEKRSRHCVELRLTSIDGPAASKTSVKSRTSQYIAQTKCLEFNNWKYWIDFAQYNMNQYNFILVAEVLWLACLCAPPPSTAVLLRSKFAASTLLSTELQKYSITIWIFFQTEIYWNLFICRWKWHVDRGFLYIKLLLFLIVNNRMHFIALWSMRVIALFVAYRMLSEQTDKMTHLCTPLWCKLDLGKMGIALVKNNNAG